MKSTNKEESYAAAIADGEKRGLKQGFGEILDESLMSKTEIAEAYPIVPPEQIEAEIDKYLAEANEWEELFGPDAPKPTREEARERILRRNAEHKAKTYRLEYNDGTHDHEYDDLMSLADAKAEIEQNVRRYFAGDPQVEYLDWGGELEAIVKYQIKDDNGRSVAHITLESA